MTTQPSPYNPRVVGVLLPAVAIACLVHPGDLDREMGRRALPWLPPDLARQVVKHQREFDRGSVAAAAWPRQLHHPGGPAGLEVAIAAQCERLVQALRIRTPFSEVVAGLGSLAHLTLDLETPFTDHTGQDAHAQAFSAYLRTATPRIPLVFYGQESFMMSVQPRSCASFLRVRRQEAAQLGPIVREDLDRMGGPDEWSSLDDRSSSFGSASLVVNHAVTDFANLASWVWLRAGGLVPPIPSAQDTILVWRGDPIPREIPSAHIRLR